MINKKVDISYVDEAEKFPSTIEKLNQKSLKEKIVEESESVDQVSGEAFKNLVDSICSTPTGQIGDAQAKEFIKLLKKFQKIGDLDEKLTQINTAIEKILKHEKKKPGDYSPKDKANIKYLNNMLSENLIKKTIESKFSQKTEKSAKIKKALKAEKRLHYALMKFDQTCIALSRKSIDQISRAEVDSFILQYLELKVLANDINVKDVNDIKGFPDLKSTCKNIIIAYINVNNREIKANEDSVLGSSKTRHQKNLLILKLFIQEKFFYLQEFKDSLSPESKNIS